MGEFVHPLILHVLPLLLNQFISKTKKKTLMLFNFCNETYTLQNCIVVEGKKVLAKYE